MKTLFVEIEDPVDGYAQYKIINTQGITVWKSSAPAFLARDLAYAKMERLTKERQST